ncbi:MAG: FdtA/QdtA family cupin domain-containing protein [bacterium]
MARLINLNTFTDSRGNLTVIEKVLPFEIKRVFYIYGVDNSLRGNHRHIKTIQAAISLKGSCRIFSKNGSYKDIEEFVLDKPSKCLILEPEDFHWMDNFTSECILMVFASEFYNAEDYITEPYK